MTNDQRTIVSGSEPTQFSQQETVQLTELLPVEQSRIKLIPDYTDQETTDGLRALRSFARGEHQDFLPERQFDSYRKIEGSICANATSESSQRCARKRRKNSPTDFGMTNGIGTRSAALRNNGKRYKNRIIETTRSATGDVDEDDDNDEVDDDDDDNDEASCEQWIETRVDKELGGKKLRSQSEERLDSIDVEDEVYYYRRQQPDIGQASTTTKDDQDANEVENENDDDSTTNLEILSAGVYRDMANNFSGGTTRLTGDKSDVTDKPSLKKEKKNGEKASKGRKTGRKKKSVGRREATRRENNEVTTSQEAEKDLRQKIDGIIQANYLLEQENNNVVRRNENEAATATSRQNVKILSKTGESSTPTTTSTETTKKYRCLMCDSSFKGSGGLRNHYKVVHAAGPVYKCDECGKEFPLKERLKLHVRTHTGFKPYKCSECHKSFARGGQLVQHRGTHSKVKPYRCNLCAGTFTCAANLALHVKRHNGQKDHKCEICGRGFVRKDALKKHLECLHRDVKSFLCVICNKTFKGHLPQHMRTHAQDRPHGCATCGQRFAQKSQLTVHQRTHSGQRPFRCLVCWQAFAHSTALKLHTRRHTGERPFKCAECNAGFTQLPHWKKHMKCIHGRSEPYSCKNCNSFFRIKNDLENHEKACHCDENSSVSRQSKPGGIGPDATTTTTTATTVSLESNNSLSSSSSSSSSSSANSADTPKFRSMNVERMRLLLAVLLKRISRPERLDELGFGKRLIDEVLQDSLVSAGKEPSRVSGELDELESLRKNLETFLEWTVPKEHWDNFRKINKTPEEILETLTAT